MSVSPPRIILKYSLPTIVVAGNQSSGKSSLIEAISGVGTVALAVDAINWTCASEIG